MPAATIAERVGWAGSPSLFRAKVAGIRPDYAVVRPPVFRSISCVGAFDNESANGVMDAVS
jgi:hypothetical protein